MHRFAIKWLFPTHRCLYFICSKPQHLIQFAYKMAISDVCLVFSWFENFLKNHYFSIKWLIPRSHSAPRIYIKRLKPVHMSAILYGGFLRVCSYEALPKIFMKSHDLKKSGLLHNSMGDEISSHIFWHLFIGLCFARKIDVFLAGPRASASSSASWCKISATCGKVSPKPPSEASKLCSSEVKNFRCTAQCWSLGRPLGTKPFKAFCDGFCSFFVHFVRACFKMFLDVDLRDCWYWLDIFSWSLGEVICVSSEFGNISKLQVIYGTKTTLTCFPLSKSHQITGLCCFQRPQPGWKRRWNSSKDSPLLCWYDDEHQTYLFC